MAHSVSDIIEPALQNATRDVVIQGVDILQAKLSWHLTGRYLLKNSKHWCGFEAEKVFFEIPLPYPSDRTSSINSKMSAKTIDSILL
jgi:hypothetical protein